MSGRRRKGPDPTRPGSGDPRERRRDDAARLASSGSAMAQGVGDAPAFAELVAATRFSFLRGASHPADMVGRAAELGLAGIGIADRNTVAGVVRAHVARREAVKAAALAGLDAAALTRLIVGARLVFADGTPDIVAYPASRRGWGELTKLLTVGNLRSVKGDCILHYDDLTAYADDLLLIVLPDGTATAQTAHRSPVDYEAAARPPPEAIRQGHLSLVPPPRPADLESLLTRLRRIAPNRVWLAAPLRRDGRDARRLAELDALSARTGAPLIATADALYAVAEDRPVQDILTCIRTGTTIATAGRALEAHAERHLHAPAEMARLYAACPQAVAETVRFLDRVGFSLDQLRYEYPDEPVPEGWTAQQWLEELTVSAAHARYGPRIPPAVQALLDAEFALIRARDYAPYFLTVYDIVAFARMQGILCQGRGSAANSMVCFLLGVTSVDPQRHDLLFSRFVSEERDEPPDIDVDFEHERREEVMQYIYERYGRHRAGIAATVIHFRTRGAVREAAKALGMSADIADRMVGTVWGSYSGEGADRRIAEAGFDLANPEIARLYALVARLLASPFPRHLSQHVGGFVLTRGRLDETVPLHHGGMDGRSFIEWDKDDIDALGLMKVDILALGMLSCIRKAFDLMREQGLGDHHLTVDIDADDPAVYDMLCRGDSIGVFQVESRAQINMLPRLRPRNLYDLTIQVAIVRPGPIEGDMVHPYLRRRSGEEPVVFPAPAPDHGPPDELKRLLGKTCGVPLFQEQAMKLAITAARFTDVEANQLRRAMATFRNLGAIHHFRDKLVDGMMARGYEREFAERCFRQIEGFGSYGFPESHALSFARLVYVSAWIKRHQPAIFACALLNSQPMGFYAPAQIVRDAREHGVAVHGPDVNASHWDNSLEPLARARHAARGEGQGRALALRIGLRQIDGFREDWAGRLVAARVAAPFADMEDMARRARLPARALRLLADADACRSLGRDRRAALWEARRTPTGELPLFAAARARELGEEADAMLPAMPLGEEVATDYQVTRLSLKGHPMQFLRPIFAAEGVLSCAQTVAAKNGARVRAAGVVLVRQRPGKGNAIFITLEDESGIANVLLWARLFESQRRPVMASRLMLVEGEVQRSKEGVVHLMASRIVDRSGDLARLHEAQVDVESNPAISESSPNMGARHPRNVRILPRSRDFH